MNCDDLFPHAELWVPEAEAHVLESCENFFEFSGSSKLGRELAMQFAERVGGISRGKWRE